jgi:glycosyltransferase involved in cell wall biosynthesis
VKTNLPPVLYSLSFPHHGKYTAYHHLVDFLKYECKSITIPNRLGLLHKSQRLYSLWLKLNEYRLLPYFFSEPLRCIHYIYPENTLFKGVHWSKQAALVLTWHQPFSFFEDMPVAAKEKVREAFRVATSVVFLSNDSARQYASAFTLRNHRIILHGVDTEFFRPPAAPSEKNITSIITVGNWLRDPKCWAKTTELLLTKYQDIEVTVLCGSEGAKRYIAELAIRDPRINFVRNLSDTELRKFYHGADLAFLPLVDATANNALVECMASGVPCVVTDLPATREYAADTALFFDNSDVQGAALAIGTLIDQPAMRAALSIASRTRAESLLSWSLIANEHRALYEEALSIKGGS